MHGKGQGTQALRVRLQGLGGNNFEEERGRGNRCAPQQALRRQDADAGFNMRKLLRAFLLRLVYATRFELFKPLPRHPYLSTTA